MITIDLVKAKAITQDRRVAKRALEFAPLDIQATIPSQAASAEAARQAIRDYYDTMQTSIDNAPDVATLKSLIAEFEARP